MARIELDVDTRDLVTAEQRLQQDYTVAVEQASRWLKNYIQRNHLRGGGPPPPSRNLSVDKLRRISGTLARQTVLRPARKIGRFVVASIYYGADYAGYHIAESPRSSTRINRRTGRSRTYKTRVHTNDIFLKTRDKLLTIISRELNRR